MPAKIKQHKPYRPLPDDQTNRVARERQQRRFLPTWSVQWRAIRKAQLERFPLCASCGQPANEVDHIEGDTRKNLIGIDLASLCKPCHSSKTGGRLIERGCDVDGSPRMFESKKSLAGQDSACGRSVARAFSQMRIKDLWP